MLGSRVGEPVPRSIAPTLWSAIPVIAATGLAFSLYFWTAAPGLSWSHFGADGGELLAAAVTKGVPHPPGYPLYTILLRTWLLAGQSVVPTLEIARLGNLLNVVLAAASVPPVVLIVRYLCDEAARKWQIPFLAGLFWAISPLLWQQALITEVYAMHIALVSWLGYLLLARPLRVVPLAIATAFGVAVHGTFVILLPALYYQIFTQRSRMARSDCRTRKTATLPRVETGAGFLSRLADSSLGLYIAPIAGIIAAAAIYLYIPLAAGSHPPPPVNWGYADNWRGLVWLVSGAAYRQYLFAVPFTHLLGRLAAWAAVIATQYTPAGLAIALLGLAEWDRTRPHLRNFSLLWVLPMSVYAIGYNTQDSNIYLLPITWLCAVWLGVGANVLVTWLGQRARFPALPALALAALIAISLPGRIDNISLRNDTEAQSYITTVAATLSTIESAPLIVSSSDRQTFALWYGAWASGELTRLHPDLVLVNSALYHYDWYRRLLGDRHPGLGAVEPDFLTFVARQRSERPVLFTELVAGIDPEQLEAIGPLWRYTR